MPVIMRAVLSRATQIGIGFHHRIQHHAAAVARIQLRVIAAWEAGADSALHLKYGKGKAKFDFGCG